MDFSVIVPTYRRPEDLRRCLGSVLGQTQRPAEVIVIDDDQLDDGFLRAQGAAFRDVGIEFRYYRKNHEIQPRGLSESKNLAMGMVTAPIFFVLDDDVILDPDFCQRVMAVWRERADDPNLVGVGGIIKNNRRRSWWEKAFHAVFGLSSPLAWDVNPVGFQNWDDHIQERAVGHYAHGGVCSYDLNKVRQLGGWATFSGGRTALEDVDFCARAKQKGWHFVIEPTAKLEHHPSPAGREGEYLAGRKEGTNRVEIFRWLNPRPGIGRRLWFFWASCGWVLRQILAGHFRKAIGLTVGVATAHHP